jgi:hypothetical protein
MIPRNPYKISFVLLNREITIEVYEDSCLCSSSSIFNREVGVELLTTAIERIVNRNIPETLSFELHGTLRACVTIRKTMPFGGGNYKIYSIDIEVSNDHAYLEIPINTLQKLKEDSNLFALASN